MNALTPAERATVIETALATGLTVTVGISAADTAAVVRNAQQALQLVGRSYFAKSADGTHFAIEVHQDKKTAKHKLGGVARGNIVDGVQQILNDPSLQEKLSGADFTLSTLRINALGIHALWFHADKPVTDIIIGVPLTPLRIPP
mgnify:CR=1 FL=1